ncbi:hypothetical protein B0H13DRAFT_1904614 [Mycena leptocephala]|nr:hypothetical protein B0H13DRAFT_1904614 [Mycena leptocephala]
MDDAPSSSCSFLSAFVIVSFLTLILKSDSRDGEFVGDPVEKASQLAQRQRPIYNRSSSFGSPSNGAQAPENITCKNGKEKKASSTSLAESPHARTRITANIRRDIMNVRVHRDPSVLTREASPYIIVLASARRVASTVIQGQPPEADGSGSQRPKARNRFVLLRRVRGPTEEFAGAEGSGPEGRRRPLIAGRSWNDDGRKKARKAHVAMQYRISKQSAHGPQFRLLLSIHYLVTTRHLFSIHFRPHEFLNQTTSRLPEQYEVDTSLSIAGGRQKRSPPSLPFFAPPARGTDTPQRKHIFGTAASRASTVAAIAYVNGAEPTEPPPAVCQQLGLSTTRALLQPPHTFTYAAGARYGKRVARQSRTRAHSSALLIGICALAPNDDSPSDQERPLRGAGSRVNVSVDAATEDDDRMGEFIPALDPSPHDTPPRNEYSSLPRRIRQIISLQLHLDIMLRFSLASENAGTLQISLQACKLHTAVRGFFKRVGRETHKY